MENERQDLYRSPEIERFLADVIVKKPEIVPVFDLELGYRYLDVEEGLKKKPEESREFLERLANVGILERRLHVMGLRCPKCDGSNVDTRYVCPFCGSIDVKKDALIEHVACGYIDVMTNFKRDGDYICPKCRNKLEPGSYRSAGSWYGCVSCGKRVEFPTPQHKCRRCEIVFNLDGAIYERVYTYSLSKIAKDEIGHGILLRSVIRERAATVGYDIKAPYSVKGDSGVEHTFDMLLLKQDEKTAVDVILSDGPISQIEIIKEYTKVIDTKEILYLIVIPELGDDARKLVEFYKMRVIESVSPQGALEALIEELKSGKRVTEGKPIKVVVEAAKKREEKGGLVSGLKGALNFRSLLKRRK